MANELCFGACDMHRRTWPDSASSWAWMRGICSTGLLDVGLQGRTSARTSGQLADPPYKLSVVKVHLAALTYLTPPCHHSQTQMGIMRRPPRVRIHDDRIRQQPQLEEREAVGAYFVEEPCSTTPSIKNQISPLPHSNVPQNLSTMTHLVPVVMISP